MNIQKLFKEGEIFITDGVENIKKAFEEIKNNERLEEDREDNDKYKPIIKKKSKGTKKKSNKHKRFDYTKKNLNMKHRRDDGSKKRRSRNKKKVVGSKNTRRR